MFGYRFINSELIVNAFTHPSCVGFECYERLELLGDAVVGFYVAQKIYHMNEDWDEGNMTDLKGSLVSNRHFGIVLLERWHRGIAGTGNTVLRTLSDCLMCVPDSRQPILEFVGEWEAVRQLLLSNTTNNPFTKTLLESPKLLANIYEAIIGAVFLDGGSSLTVVEEVFGPDFANFTVKEAQTEIERVFEQRKQEVKRQHMLQRAVQKEERRLKKAADEDGEGSKDQNATVEADPRNEESVQKDPVIVLPDGAKDKNGTDVVGEAPASAIKHKRHSVTAIQENPETLYSEKAKPKDDQSRTDVLKEEPALPSKRKRNGVVTLQKTPEILSDSALDESKPKDEKETRVLEDTTLPSKRMRNEINVSDHS